MKRILGLDLGTTSIGWAYVLEAECDSEKSAIIDAGVRLVPLSADETGDFTKGKACETNKARRLARGARRNLQRYKLRRERLLTLLIDNKIIDGKEELFPFYDYSNMEVSALRAKATQEQIKLSELAFILMILNKKRGYKSNRKAQSADDGTAVDGYEVARILNSRGITPAQYLLENENKGKFPKAEFYSSDLKNEFRRIIECQKQWYAATLNETLLRYIEHNGERKVLAYLYATEHLTPLDLKRDEAIKTVISLRIKGLTQQLSAEELTTILGKFGTLLSGGSSLLASISDRSKELLLGDMTIGEYLHSNASQQQRTKNLVFYRQDYIAEFEKIWQTQAQFHLELTDSLKKNIAERTLFYQRPLRSQKDKISHCQFEKHHRCIPKSAPLFQYYKTLCSVNLIKIQGSDKEETRFLTASEREKVAKLALISQSLTPNEVLDCLKRDKREYKINVAKVEGNITMAKLLDIFIAYLEQEKEYKFGKDRLQNYDAVLANKEIGNIVKVLFENYTQLSHYDSNSLLFKLWHLIYSYQGDNSRSGIDKLIEKITTMLNTPVKLAKQLAQFAPLQDYGNLSSRAIKRIVPHLEKGAIYSDACKEAGYNHSHSTTKEENLSRVLAQSIALLPKNSLRNPVVEKILNQMIHVVNNIIQDIRMGQPDEIRVELARDLKLNAEQRDKASKAGNDANKRNEVIRALLVKEFGIQYPSGNDILRYRLYEELASNGYKTLYSNQYILREELFSNKYDREHIIPQALLFNNSFSNQTIELSSINKEKDKRTALDYVAEKYGNVVLDEYTVRIKKLRANGTISAEKCKNLLMTQKDIPSNFIERDLRNTQYISKKAQELLATVCRNIVATSGQITARLREDWGLINVMKEINLDKYRALGRVSQIENRNGQSKTVIDDWTKRDDHRHHAVDAITVAFTRRAYIQYLNTLNAREDTNSVMNAIGDKYMYVKKGKKLFIPPTVEGNFRHLVEEKLNDILISFKAKNKVVTPRKNKIKCGKDSTMEQRTLTPRGQLHNETLYKKATGFEVKEITLSGKMDIAMANNITNPDIKEAVLNRLAEYDNDAKKAFTGKNSADKNPLTTTKGITLDGSKTIKVKLPYTYFTTKKAIDENLKIDDIIDEGVKQILRNRLSEFNGSAKNAFSNLSENPIWFNEEQGIKLEKVRVRAAVNPEAIRTATDRYGKAILHNNNEESTAFVNTSNNHHSVIYMDEKGKVQERLVTFFEATQRAISGNEVINKTMDSKQTFMFSIMKNQCFLIPDDTICLEELDITAPENRVLLAPYLYRVQKFSSKYYTFRYHLETKLDDAKELNGSAYYRIRSLDNLKNIIKVRINHLGHIVAIGE